MTGKLMTRQLLRLSLTLFLFLSSTLFMFAVADGAWLASVPAHDHEKTNPYQDQPDAIAAGRRIYVDHCLHCHGDSAQGTKKRPPLTSQRVQRQATPGDLHWLLVNGNMKKGMPSWAKLPDPQLWQLITYLKTLHQ
jgi:mono/diheme cytochrome c family protein